MLSPSSKGGSINGDEHQHVTGLSLSDEEEDTSATAKAAPETPFLLAHRSTTSMIQPETIKYPQWHNSVAGGVAGAGARLFTAPLDLVRIRAQLERRDIYPRPSILTRMIHVYKAEGGITALFRGNLAASYLWVGYTTVQFSVYGTIKERIEDYRDDVARVVETPQITQQTQYQQQLSNLLINPTATAFVSGAGAGICATIATYPFDICRTVFASKGALTQQQREQPKGKTFRPPSTIKECAISMYRQRGIRGFYAGSAPAVVQIVPYMGFNFAIYDFLITQGEDSRSSKSVGLSGCAGSIGGAVSKIIVYPMDTIKKRIQIQSVFGASPCIPVIYNGIWDCLVTTIRTEGVLGLYRGLFPSVLKTTLGAGLSFTFFRSTKNMLENTHDNC
jgi:solute carrier family 25 thiamine pyrophosphate transporter 19